MRGVFCLLARIIHGDARLRFDRSGEFARARAGFLGYRCCPCLRRLRALARVARRLHASFLNVVRGVFCLLARIIHGAARLRFNRSGEFARARAGFLGYRCRPCLRRLCALARVARRPFRHLLRALRRLAHQSLRRFRHPRHGVFRGLRGLTHGVACAFSGMARNLLRTIQRTAGLCFDRGRKFACALAGFFRYGCRPCLCRLAGGRNPQRRLARAHVIGIAGQHTATAAGFAR